MSDLKRMPSEIIRGEQIVLTCESEENGLGPVMEFSGAGTVLYASDYCHWDCHFPFSVKDIVDQKDLTLAQKERLLGKNAVDFFELKNLPEPRALSIARRHWEQEGKVKEAARA